MSPWQKVRGANRLLSGLAEDLSIRYTWLNPRRAKNPGEYKPIAERWCRVSNKQLNYIVTLGRSLKLNSKDLDQENVKTYGVKMALEFMPGSDQGRRGKTLPPVIP
jgi:hypothetical protein